jgi:outer membrane protein assembly factor BamB
MISSRFRSLAVFVLAGTVLLIAGYAIARWILRPRAPEIVWVRQLGRSGTGFCSDIAVDSRGDVWLGGMTDGALLAKRTQRGRSERSKTGFLAKYNGGGRLLEVRQVGSAVDRIALGVLPDDALYVDDGWKDICRVSPDGRTVWEEPFFSRSALYIRSIVTHSRTAIFAVGNTWDWAIDQPFVVRLNSDGSTVWTRMLGRSLGATGSHTPEVFDAAVDASGSIFIVGVDYPSGFLLALDAKGRLLWRVKSPEPAEFVRVNSNGIYVGTAASRNGNAASLMKYDLTGKRLWFRQLSEHNHMQIRDMALHRTGSIYMLISRDYTRTASNMLVKRNADGTLLWTKALPTNDAASTGIALGQEGAIYICATAGSHPIHRQNHHAILVMKLTER